MNTLYPPLEAFNTGYLQVDAEHSVYFEECGNPKGKPVLFLHGGPGSGTEPYHRQYFDPNVYRIVLLDQRGSGKSKPFASLSNNTTWDLVSDIERLREKLKIENWIVFGGSWGSTLALAYAETHPMRIKGLILRGIFMCRKTEIEWFYQYGAHHLFPDEWDKYVSIIPKEERHDLVAAYYRRLTSTDERVQMLAAKHWSRWEGATIRLVPNLELIEHFTADKHALSISRIECHYFVNKAFFETDGWLLENVEKIRHIPAIIVHGRYDVVCPVENAWALHKAWPESQLEIVATAGHAAAEPGIVDALIRATKKFQEL